MTTLDFDELHRLVDASLRTQTEDEVIETVRGLLTNAYERAVADMEEEFEFFFILYPEYLKRAIEMPIEGLNWEERIRSWYHGKNPNMGKLKASLRETEDELREARDQLKEAEDKLRNSEEKIRESEEKSAKGNTPMDFKDEIQRVVDTEYHRMYNTGAYDTATEMENEGYPVMKRWITMGDDRVRDTHSYIDDELVPLDEEFYTYDGDSAMFPGDFSNPANNINCRCICTYEMKITP